MVDSFLYLCSLFSFRKWYTTRNQVVSALNLILGTIYLATIELLVKKYYQLALLFLRQKLKN